MHGLTMSKWGLSMAEGRVVAWLVAEGAAVTAGAAVVEVETEKALNVVEAPVAGCLRRQVARAGDVVPVGGLLGVIADASTAAADIDRFVADAPARVVAQSITDAAPLSQTATVRGLSLRYVRRGEGEPPAVLIHGFGGDLNTWMFNHEALAARRAVYALDLPGHGGSSKRVDKGDLRDLADFVSGFMAAVGVSAAHLVGHSMGGAVAIELARSYPERCRSLVLLAPAGLGPEIDGEFITGFIAAKRRKDIKPYLDRLFADPRLAGRQLVEEVLKYKRLDGVESALRTIAAEFSPNGKQAVLLRDALLHLPLPILLLWGAQDRILPPSHAHGLPPSIRTAILPAVGHLPHLEAAARVNQLIASFWEEMRAASP